MFKNIYKNKYKSGVTLVELIVVVAIFSVISSIVIFNYGNLNSSLSIQNLADDIALSVRKAQGYAIGVRGYAGVFGKGYGVHFTANPNSTVYDGSNKAFVLFADISNDKQYNNSGIICGTPTASDECLEILKITSADKILEISKNGEATPISPTSTIDLVFSRPNPEPTFCYKVNGTGSCNFSISGIKIKIVNVNNSQVFRIITISNNGQISVS